jgi:hypothetical protein
MQAIFTLNFNHMLKKTIICMALIGVVALASASSGGGDKKKAASVPSIAAIKTTPGYSLRAGRSYSNALSLKKQSNFAQSNTILTYRKGNSIYILPTAGKLQKPAAGRTNLNLLNLKMNLRK